MSRNSVLLVDDDAVFRAALERHLDREGYTVAVAGDAEGGLELLHERPFDVVLTDLRMPGVDGTELVRRIRQLDPEALCIVVTGFGSPERSVQALRAGAFWFIEKNYESLETFGMLIEKALGQRRLSGRNRELQRQLQVRYGFDNIVGHSAGLRGTLDEVRKVAGSDATVLVLGESGVGKELIARALHYNSRRRDQPFVAVNCGAIPEQLLESELFGHVRGAFTGAHRDREGRFRTAHLGTLFLDEIGDMTPNLQAKLLRVLQEHEFEPVGSSTPERVDVRIIAATNQDLAQLIRDRRFRQDLYFRLSVVPIEVPPLRRRREDIPLLVEHFLNLQRRAYPDLRGVSDFAMKRLTEYEWPGNVRELENLIERTALLTQKGWIGEEDLPRHVTQERPVVERFALPPDGVDFSAVVDDFENELIVQALEATGWNKKQAAELLGLKRTTLVEKIRAKKLEPSS